MFSSLLKSSACVAAALLLAACSGGTVKETLGLKRSTPDEFRVVSRPPLSVPPEFNLQPPAPGDEGGIAGVSANEQAAGLVLGTGAPEQSLETRQRLSGAADTAVPVVTSGELRSAADANFLDQAGVAKADPGVRQKLYTEQRAATAKEEESGFFDKLLPDKKDLSKEPTVDSAKEAERIRQNKDEGKSVTEGETPEIKKKTSVLQNLLGN